MKKSRKTILFPAVMLLTAVLLSGCGDSGETIVLSREGETAEDFAEEESKEEAAKEEIEEAEIEVTEKICVFICGAVKQEGVYYLEKGARLYEGIQAAGGFTEDADTIWHNQASILEDGSRIQIYTVKETEDFRREGIKEEDQQVLENKDQISDSSENKKVNINKASAEQLQTIPGIGETKAAAIIAYRESNGNFSNVDEIQKVAGIKGKTYEKIQPYITTEEK
ncbi:MAG: helix-hairpin-helix domain-containing protein [Blautia sp.]